MANTFVLESHPGKGSPKLGKSEVDRFLTVQCWSLWVLGPCLFRPVSSAACHWNGFVHHCSKSNFLKGKTGWDLQHGLCIPCAKSSRSLDEEGYQDSPTYKSVKGSLTSHGCCINHLWVQQCECVFIYFDTAYVLCNQRTSPGQSQPLSLGLSVVGRQESHTPGYSKKGLV